MSNDEKYLVNLWEIVPPKLWMHKRQLPAIVWHSSGNLPVDETVDVLVKRIGEMIKLHCVMCGNLFRPEKLMQGTIKGGPVEYANCPKCGGVVIAPENADTPDPIVEVADMSTWTAYDYIPMMFENVSSAASHVSEGLSEWQIRLLTRRMEWSPVRDKFLEWCDTSENFYNAWIAYWKKKGRLTERAF